MDFIINTCKNARVSRKNTRSARGFENRTTASGRASRRKCLREMHEQHMRCSARTAPSKVQKSMYRLKHAFPLKPALAYIVWPVHALPSASRFRVDKSAELFSPRRRRLSSHRCIFIWISIASPWEAKRSRIFTYDVVCVCVCVLECNSIGNATVDCHMQIRTQHTHVLSFSSRLSPTFSFTHLYLRCTHAHAYRNLRMRRKGTSQLELVSGSKLDKRNIRRM